MKTLLDRSGGSYWTDLVGVHRWGWACEKQGLYCVIRLPLMADFLNFYGFDDLIKSHPYAVVDDFGNLVKVQ